MWANVVDNVPPKPLVGIMGMGYSHIPNFLDNAYAANQISSPVFALSLTKNTSSLSGFYYNNIPQSIISNTIFVDQFGLERWQVEVITVNLGGIDFSAYSAKSAIIDSGTTIFYLNYELYNAVIL